MKKVIIKNIKSSFKTAKDWCTETRYKPVKIAASIAAGWGLSQLALTISPYGCAIAGLLAGTMLITDEADNINCNRPPIYTLGKMATGLATATIPTAHAIVSTLKL